MLTKVRVVSLVEEELVSDTLHNDVPGVHGARAAHQCGQDGIGGKDVALCFSQLRRDRFVRMFIAPLFCRNEIKATLPQIKVLDRAQGDCLPLFSEWKKKLHISMGGKTSRKDLKPCLADHKEELTRSGSTLPLTHNPKHVRLLPYE